MSSLDYCLAVNLDALCYLTGQGKIVQFYNGSAPIRNVLEAFDFPEAYLKELYSFPLELVSTIQDDMKIRSQEKPSNATESVDAPAASGLSTERVDCQDSDNGDKMEESEETTNESPAHDPSNDEVFTKQYVNSLIQLNHINK